MTLLSQGKTQNVKVSLEKYIQDNLEITEGIVIDYEGTSGEPFEEDEWISENIMDFSDPTYLRGTGGNQRGQKYSILLNFNVFVKREKTNRTNRHYEIRDLIGKYFYVGKDIDLYDFEAGNFSSSLQKMRIREIVTDRPIPDDTYWQYAYTVGIEWIQEWAI